MARATDIERVALDGSTQSTLGRLLWALAVIWLPTLFVWGLLYASGASVSSDADKLSERVGTRMVEPLGGLQAVLFVPMAAVMELGALWWGAHIWIQERRKRQQHRRRRRKPFEKFLQRLAFVVVAVSMVANLPPFLWMLWKFHQISIKF